jgi:hypothetical protein
MVVGVLFKIILLFLVPVGDIMLAKVPVPMSWIRNRETRYFLGLPDPLLFLRIRILLFPAFLRLTAVDWNVPKNYNNFGTLKATCEKSMVP